MKQKRMLGVSFVAGLFSTFILAIDDREQSVSFDAVFLQTHYKKALDSCMQVWADLEVLLVSRDDVSPEDRELLLYAAVGRMAYSGVCLELVLKDNVYIPANDLVYLSRVLDRIEDRCVAFSCSSDDVHMKSLKRMHADVRKKLRLLMAKIV